MAAHLPAGLQQNRCTDQRPAANNGVLTLIGGRKRDVLEEGTAFWSHASITTPCLFPLSTGSGWQQPGRWGGDENGFYRERVTVSTSPGPFDGGFHRSLRDFVYQQLRRPAPAAGSDVAFPPHSEGFRLVVRVACASPVPAAPAHSWWRSWLWDDYAAEHLPTVVAARGSARPGRPLPARLLDRRQVGRPPLRGLTPEGPWPEACCRSRLNPHPSATTLHPWL